MFVQSLLGKWLLFLMDSLKGLGWLGGNAWGGRAGTLCDASFYEQGRAWRGGLENSPSSQGVRPRAVSLPHIQSTPVLREHT